MTIGEKIKELRKKNDLTQEKLADYLCVSYQAVSKWETGVASPDLSLIAPLTKLLHVSADELLGLNQTEPDARYIDLTAQYYATFKTDNLAKRQKICETAVSEYPGDMKFLSHLAWTVSNRSFKHEDNESYVAEQEKAIKLFGAVIRNCGDELLRENAIEGIVQLLGWRGRKDEAKKYAEMLPESTVINRDSVWEYCLDGDELIEFKQKRIQKFFGSLLWELSLMPVNSDYCKDLMETLVRDMIPDGNYLGYNLSLYRAKKSRINSEMKKTGVDYDFIIKLIGEMRSYAYAFDEIAYVNQGIHRNTAVVFDHIEENSLDWCNPEGSLMDDFKKYLSDNQFDILRDREEFKALS